MSIRIIAAVDVPDEDYGKLTWLARQRGVPVRAIVAGYIRLCLAGEDFTGYETETSQEVTSE